MRYPEFLKENGRIGFIAPSFGCTTEPYRTLFDDVQKQWRSKGYGIVLGPNCYADSGVGKSNTPRACADEINDFFTNDRSDIIISCGGGETMCEDLPYVDFDAISRAVPKWYMGYSDNTNLTFTLPTLADTAAIYGPCVSSFGMRPLHPALNDAFDLISGKNLTVHNYDSWELESVDDETNPFEPYNLTESFKLRAFMGTTEISDSSEKIEFSGRLLGGCLDCLSNLVGTPFDKVKEFNEKYADNGVVWYLEACDLNVMSIRRALWQLDQAGWFSRARGFLIGRPRLYNDAWGEFDRIAAVMGVLGKYGVPVILDLDIGHLPPMMPVISGAIGDVSVYQNTFTMTHRLV